MELEVEEYVRTLHFGMMEVTYEWARQLPFREICDLTGTSFFLLTILLSLLIGDYYRGARGIDREMYHEVG